MARSQNHSKNHSTDMKGKVLKTQTQKGVLNTNQSIFFYIDSVDTCLGRSKPSTEIFETMNGICLPRATARGIYYARK